MAKPLPHFDPIAAGCRCDICPLNRKRFVPPEGPDDAEIVIVGEAPGAQEELKRRPFVGPSGQLLSDILREAAKRAGLRDLPRDRVWVTNALLCRAEVPGEKGKKRYDLKRYLAWLHAYNKKEARLAKREERAPALLPSPFYCCRPRLMRELKWFEHVAIERGQPGGAVVIPTGNYATYVITGKIGIMKWRGSPLQSDKDFVLSEEEMSHVPGSKAIH
jgi:uracil-DNA glycosylase